MNAKPKSPKRIPVTAAKAISQAYNYPEVVVFAYDPVTGKQHITTYGDTKARCRDAAKAADFLKLALKWPSHYTAPSTDSTFSCKSTAEVLADLERTNALVQGGSNNANS